MDFFFITFLFDAQSDVVLTENCQIYGLPLTSHVILGKNRDVQILAKITWHKSDSDRLVQHQFLNLKAPNKNIVKKIFFNFVFKLP